MVFSHHLTKSTRFVAAVVFILMILAGVYLLLDAPAGEYPALTKERAKELVVAAWGDCQEEVCDNLEVELINGRGFIVQATYFGVKDDSVRALRKRAEAIYSGEWSLDEDFTEEYQCQSGRGHQDWSDEFCI